MLILNAVVGSRIWLSFAHSRLAKERPDVTMPALFEFSIASR